MPMRAGGAETQPGAEGSRTQSGAKTGSQALQDCGKPGQPIGIKYGLRLYLTVCTHDVRQ